MIHYTLVHTCKKTTINIIGLDNTKNTIKNSPLRSLHDPTSIAKDQRKKEKRRKKEEKKRKIDSEEEKIKLSIKPWSIWNVNPEMDGGLGSVTRDEKSRWRRNVGTGWERRGNSMPGRLTRGRRNTFLLLSQTLLYTPFVFLRVLAAFYRPINSRDRIPMETSLVDLYTTNFLLQPTRRVYSCIPRVRSTFIHADTHPRQIYSLITRD